MRNPSVMEKVKREIKNTKIPKRHKACNIAKQKAFEKMTPITLLTLDIIKT